MESEIIQKYKQSENYLRESNSNEYKIKDLDSGEIFDIRKNNDSIKIDTQLVSLIKSNENKINYLNENHKIKEKINTKFFKACERGDFKKIKEILNKKVSNDRKPKINDKYLHNYTVLHIAITNDKGADIEAETTMKRTPFHLATLHGQFEVIDYLISCGAVINCKDIDSNTPLHYASRTGKVEIVEYLLNKRADYSLTNIYNETALDIVCESKINLFRSNYTRNIVNNQICHNNRCDNIRKIIYKDKMISQCQTDSFKTLTLSCVYNEIDFPSDFKVDLNSFKILELLGKGSFGEVYLVELICNNKKYAMKVLNKSRILNQNIVRYVVTERNVLSNIRHPFIVQLYYTFQTDDFLYLILEYCEGKDLCYHLKINKRFDEETVKILLAQLLLAIEELHRNNIIYRDLKPENIVLDKNGFIKLTDFGLSKEGIKDNTSAKSFCGSLAYLAPEVLNRQGHGKSVDWYLFGVLMYEMLTGIPPYYTNVSKEALFYNMKYGKLGFPKKFPSEAKNLIKKLLHRNPNKRLGSGILDADEIKSQAFFSDINFNKILVKQFIPPKFILSHFSKLNNKKDNTNNVPNAFEFSEEIPKHLLKDFICNKEVCEDMKKNKKSEESSIKGWTFIGSKKYTI